MSGTTTLATNRQRASIEQRNNSWRYEKKFIPEAISVPVMVSLIRRHRAVFYEAYPERLINNLYLDTPVLNHFYEHVDGVTIRRKVRIRWYGNTACIIPKPMLEFKIKHGAVSTKTSYALPALPWNGNMANGLDPWWTTHVSQLSPDAKAAFATMRPTLLNQYRRLYFKSADRGIRLTVDFALSFGDPQTSHFLHSAQDANLPNLVLEMKYPPEQAEEAHQIANDLPFRACRCSKYVLGMTWLGW